MHFLRFSVISVVQCTILILSSRFILKDVLCIDILEFIFPRNFCWQHVILILLIELINARNLPGHWALVSWNTKPTFSYTNDPVATVGRPQWAREILVQGFSLAWDLSHWWIFHYNLKLSGNFILRSLIFEWTDCTAVVACAKIWGSIIARNGIPTKWILIVEFELGWINI